MQPKTFSSFPTEPPTLVSLYHSVEGLALQCPAGKHPILHKCKQITSEGLAWKATYKLGTYKFGKSIATLGCDALICLHQLGKETLEGTGDGCRKVFKPLAVTLLVLQAVGKHAIHPSSPWLWWIKVAGFAFLTRHTHELNIKLRQEKRQAAAGADDHWSFPCEGVTFGNPGPMSCDRARK